MAERVIISHTLAAPGSVESRRQYIYARSRTSGESHSFVAVFSTRCTTPCDESGFFKYNFTTAVSVCNCTYDVILSLLIYKAQVGKREKALPGMILL